MSTISDCKAKNPLTCPYHGLESIDRLSFAPDASYADEETERTEILNFYLAKNNLTVDDLKIFDECQSRPNVTEENKHRFKLNETKIDLIICSRCGNKHPVSKEPRPDNYYSSKQNFKILNSLLTSAKKGKHEFIGEVYEVRFNPRIAVLFDNASNQFTKYNLSREDLVLWYVCGRKVQYKTRQEASQSAYKQNTTSKNLPQPLSVYLCPLKGDHYHIGKKGKDKANKGDAWNPNGKEIVARARKMFDIYEQHGRLKFPLVPDK